jgi:hypothetical protein
MTLTDVLPTLRHSLPLPLAVDRWPSRTEATPTDVVVAAISMLRYAQLCGTPCVHGGPAVVPGTGGRPSATAECSIVVLSVTDAADGAIRVDGDLRAVSPDLVEARLVGRVSTAPRAPVAIVDRTETARDGARLPADVRAGDLLAVPCPGTIVLHDLVADAVAGAER